MPGEGELRGLAGFELGKQTPSGPFQTKHLTPDHLRDPGTILFRPPGAGQVVGTDDRLAVPSPGDAPFRQVCALRITARDGSIFYGTGWLIGPRTVITAGHCLFLRRIGAGGEIVAAPYEGRARSVTVIPALDRGVEPFGHAESQRFEVAPTWEHDGDPGADLGAIFLDDDRFAHLGWLGFGAAQEPLLRALPLNIVGYPVDRDEGTRQYYAGRVVNDVDGAVLIYDTDTFGGQSGSPIWVNLGGTRVVVGLHTRGFHDRMMNSGARILPETFRRLLAWKRAGG
ncbi:MAG: trypsin-like peptidase domain-containing protein [Minicystis sp.]